MIYFMQGIEGGPIKIGHSRNISARQKQLEFRYQRPLVVLATLEGGRIEEASLHARFSHLRFGRTEQFKPAADLLEFLGKPLIAEVDSQAVEVMPNKKVEIVLRIDALWARRIHDLAESEGNTTAAFIRTTVIKELKRREREAAES